MVKKRKLEASFEDAVKAMKSQHESNTPTRRIPGYYVHLNPDTTSESTEVTTGNRSKELFMECRGNETVIDSSNTSIRNSSNEFTTQFCENKTVIESANSIISKPSNESLLQSRGSETITESANPSIANRINDVPMQLIEQNSSWESFGTNVGNCSRDVYPVTDIEDVMALFEETQETVQDTVGSEPEIHIIGNWKFLKENINPDYIMDGLISTELIDSDDCDGRGYHDKSRQCKIDHLITCVIRNIGNPSDVDKFINIFETDHKFIADKLKLSIEVPDWSKGVKNVEKCRHRLATNRKLIEKELKKPQKLFDDFLENFVFDIDDHEELCNLTGGRKKKAECFMDKVLTSVEKGSYDLILHILKREMCNIPHVYQRIVVALEKTPEQSATASNICGKVLKDFYKLRKKSPVNRCTECNNNSNINVTCYVISEQCILIEYSLLKIVSIRSTELKSSTTSIELHQTNCNRNDEESQQKYLRKEKTDVCNLCGHHKVLRVGKKFCESCGKVGRECGWCHRPLPRIFYGKSLHVCDSCIRRRDKYIQRGGGANTKEALGGSVQTTSLKLNLGNLWDILQLFVDNQVSISDILLKKLEQTTGIKWFITVFVKFVKYNENNEPIYAEPTFRSHTSTMTNGSELVEEIASSCRKVYNDYPNFERGGSGWAIDQIVKMEVNSVEYVPLSGSSYVPLPANILKKRAILNIHNKDQKCFIWSIFVALHPIPRTQNANKVSHYVQFETYLRTDSI